MKLPALLIAVFVAAGVLAASPIAVHTRHSLDVSLGVALFCIIAGFAFTGLRRPNLVWVASLLAWFSLAAAAAQIEHVAVPANQITSLVGSGRLELDAPLRWRGILRADPLRLPWGFRYDLDLDEVQSAGEWRAVHGGLRATYFFDQRAPGNPPPVRAGERVEILVRARLIRNFGDPGAFDYRGALQQQSIDLTATLRNPELMRTLPGPAPKVSHYLARLRGRLLNDLDAMLSPAEDRTAIARAMLLGDRSFLDSQQAESFRETGAFHVLVVAGLHVGMLAAFLFWAGKKLRLPIVVRAFATIAALGLYVAIIEDRPPIMRAALMAAIYLLARMLFRHVARDGSHAPKAAEFRIDLRAVSAWLRSRLPSKLAQYCDHLVVTPCRVGLRLWELAVLSIALQIGMLPLMARDFHRVSFIAPVANIPAVLLTSVVVPFGFAVLVLGAIWRTLGILLGRALSFLIATLTVSIHWFAQLPSSSVRVPSPPTALLIGFFAVALLLSAAILTQRKWSSRVALAAALVLAALMVIYPFRPRLQRGRLEVTVLDVGQGDSIFVAFPDGRTMLVDAGGLPGANYIHGMRPGLDVGEDVVSPFLWSHGLKRIDTVVVTHPHEDHLGGMFAVLRNFKVGEMWVGRDEDAPAYRNLLAEAKTRKVPVTHRLRGDHFDWAGARLNVLWPDSSDPARARNDDSLVLRLEDGKESFLLTGAIERAVERSILANDDGLAANFLKVPHHGGKTSSTPPFLEAVHPAIAAISVGEANPFGHPSPDVVDRILAEGTRLYRTDRDGAITATTDGQSLDVRSFLTCARPCSELSLSVSPAETPAF